MIIYGTTGKHYATQSLAGSCPACRAPGALQTNLISRYAHVYWIPFFPYQKLAVTQCQNCKTAWNEKELDPALAAAVRTAKQGSRAPAWTWAGLAIVAALLLYGFLSGIRNTHTDDTLLASPRVGDIYTVREDSTRLYSLLKVQQVGGNVVELVANEYQTKDASPLHSLNEPARYSKESFTLTLLDLQIMRRKGQLTDVDRLE